MFSPDMITDATEKDWNDFWHGPDINSDTQTNMTDQQMSATIYRGLFTDGEWEVIDRALGEYQDHLDDNDLEFTDEEQNYYSVQAKIHAIFKLTK